MIILLQIFLNCYYYYTFRHNISVRKIKPNPAFTLLNLYTIQFTVRSKPTQRPKPSPLTLNTVDNSRNKTRQNTLFFPPNNHHSTRQNTHLTKEYFYFRGERKATISTSTSSKTVHKDTEKRGMNRLAMNARAPPGFKICSLQIALRSRDSDAGGRRD